MTSPRILFVYNADGGLMNALWDAGHKLVSPGTYPCALCAITYGAVSMRAEWKAHLGRLPYPAAFLHRDEFRRSFGSIDVALPAILLEKDDALSVLVPADAMHSSQTVPDLIALLDAALQEQRV